VFEFNIAEYTVPISGGQKKTILKNIGMLLCAAQCAPFQPLAVLHWQLSVLSLLLLLYLVITLAVGKAEPGTYTAILGPSGAGKSTLLGMSSSHFGGRLMIFKCQRLLNSFLPSCLSNQIVSLCGIGTLKVLSVWVASH